MSTNTLTTSALESRTVMSNRLVGFVAAWQTMIDCHAKANFKGLWDRALESGRDHYESVTIDEGKRFWKIVVETAYGQRSCRAFIDKETGAIYKAASWSAPAKHVRGYITAEDYGMSCMTQYGPRYLR